MKVWEGLISKIINVFKRVSIERSIIEEITI